MSKFGIDFAVAPWMQYAEAELGVAEVAGPTDNQRILRRHHARPGALVLGFCQLMPQAGRTYRHQLGSGQMLPEPRLGYLTVLQRQAQSNPKATRIGLWVGTGPGPGQLNLLGGNQHESVRLSVFPLEQVKGFRWLA